MHQKNFNVIAHRPY